MGSASLTSVLPAISFFATLHLITTPETLQLGQVTEKKLQLEKTVPIYNQIDYVICDRRLLTDSRSYGGCELNTDHKLVVARFGMQRLYGIFGNRRRTNKQQTARVNTTKLSDLQVRSQYQQQLSENLDSVPKIRHSEDELQNTCSAVLDVVKSVALDVLGIAELSKHHCPDSEIQKLSEEQLSLRQSMANTTNPDKKATLKRKRNEIQHAIREKCRNNAIQHLEEKAKEVERLKDGAPMFKAVHLMQRRTSKKPAVKDSEGRFILGDTEAATVIQNHFATQFRGSVPCGPFQAH